MRAIMLAIPALTLGACTTMPVNDEPMEREVGHGGTCSHDSAQRFVGRKATGEVGAAIRKATGARIFQWVAPDTAVTMDYRPDRVRVSYDRAMVITSVRCG